MDFSTWERPDKVIAVGGILELMSGFVAEVQSEATFDRLIRGNAGSALEVLTDRPGALVMLP
jgi:hypothetical protein